MVWAMSSYFWKPHRLVGCDPRCQRTEKVWRCLPYTELDEANTRCSTFRVAAAFEQAAEALTRLD